MCVKTSALPYRIDVCFDWLLKPTSVPNPATPRPRGEVPEQRGAAAPPSFISGVPLVALGPGQGLSISPNQIEATSGGRRGTTASSID
jgi:hypothetical protein